MPPETDSEFNLDDYVEKEGPNVGRLKADIDDAADFTRDVADEEKELRDSRENIAWGTASEEEKTAMKNIVGDEHATPARLERGIDKMIGRELGIRRAQTDEMADWAFLEGMKGKMDKSHDSFDEAIRHGKETEAEYQRRSKLGHEELQRRHHLEQSGKKRRRYQPGPEKSV